MTHMSSSSAPGGLQHLAVKEGLGMMVLQGETTGSIKSDTALRCGSEVWTGWHSVCKGFAQFKELKSEWLQ